MSYAVARARLITIIEGASPSSKERGLGDKFKHDPAGGGDQPVSAQRRFWIEAGPARRWGPAQTVANVISYDVAVVVEYQAHLPNRAALDVLIAGDYEAITAALANQALWARNDPETPSTIRCIGADSLSPPDAPLFPRTVDVVEGGRRLRISFPLEVLA